MIQKAKVGDVVYYAEYNILTPSCRLTKYIVDSEFNASNEGMSYVSVRVNQGEYPMGLLAYNCYKSIGRARSVMRKRAYSTQKAIERFHLLLDNLNCEDKSL